MNYPEGKNPFKNLRELKGWKQKELVEIFKKKGFIIDDKKISRLENGNFSSLDTYTQNAYVEVFNVSNEYLLGQTLGVKTTNANIRMICKTTGLDEDSVLFLKQLKSTKSQLLDILNFLLSNFNNIVDFEEALCEYFYSHDDTPLIPVITKIDRKKIEHLSSDTTSKIFKEDVKKKKPLDERRYMLELSDKPNGNTKESFMLDKNTISTMRTIRLMESLSKLRDRFQNEGK